jgi:F-type H+-transporting ATPase subunit a
MSGAQLVLAAAEEPVIQPGHHVTGTFLGMTFNLDTIWSTAIAGLVVIGLAFWLRRTITSEVPSKIQIIWEGLVNAVSSQVESSLGRPNRWVIQLAVAEFAFILFANWLELIPSPEAHFPSGEGHLLVSPTADVNLTYAMAVLVIVGVHIHSVRQRGWKNYFKHYFQPYPILFPLNLLEELAKPVTLALRLFGNILSGGIMIALITLLPTYLFWGPQAGWKLFDMFIGLIQAFIFALLTIIYFGLAGETHDEGHGERPATGSTEHRSDTTAPVQSQPQTQAS